MRLMRTNDQERTTTLDPLPLMASLITVGMTGGYVLVMTAQGDSPQTWYLLGSLAELYSVRTARFVRFRCARPHSSAVAGCSLSGAFWGSSR